MKEETMNQIDDELDALAQALQNRERWRSPERRLFTLHQMVIACARTVVDALMLMSNERIIGEQ